jgi:hypothetical protein
MKFTNVYEISLQLQHDSTIESKNFVAADSLEEALALCLSYIKSGKAKIVAIKIALAEVAIKGDK